MAGSILILRWAGSAYDSLGGLLELIGQEMAAMGHQMLLVNAEGQDWPRKLLDLLQRERPAFALTMSGIGMEFQVQEKRSLWEAVQVPLFNWSCDHACYFPTRHAIRNRFVMHGYVFPDHARYAIRHLNPNGMAAAVHIGMPPRRVFPGAPLPLAQRNGRIIFTKSGQDTAVIEDAWRGRLSFIRDILFAAAEELFHGSTADFVPVLQRIAAPHGLFLDGNSELMLMLIRELDTYLRARRFNLVMRSLLEYPVDVFGTGWEHMNWDGARAVYHGALPWRAAAVEQLPRYLGCLSVNPLVEESLHDRVFFAIAAGVVPLSDANRFARERTPALLPYSFSFDAAQIAGAADALLANPAEALARTEASYQALAAEFTMQRAARQIIEFVGLHGANARCAD